MQTYNKIMLYFWMAVAIVSLVGVTYMTITEGFKKWGYYYVFPAVAALTFVTKRWMMKRMEKHQNYLKEQEGKQHP
jgi:hypothetical protein